MRIFFFFPFILLLKTSSCWEIKELQFVPVNESMVLIDYQPYLDSFIEDLARNPNSAYGDFSIENVLWIGIGNVSFNEERKIRIHGAIAFAKTENITLYNGQFIRNLDGPILTGPSKEVVLQPLVKGSNILAKINPCEKYENLWMIIAQKKGLPALFTFEKFAENYYCQNGKLMLTEGTKPYIFSLFIEFFSRLFNI